MNKPRRQRVDVERVIEAQRVLDDFDKLDLRKLDFFEGGKKVRVLDSLIIDFELTCLKPHRFITGGFYLGEKGD